MYLAYYSCYDLLLCYIRNAGYLGDAHIKILALHKESWECVWLRSMIEHIKETCNLSSGRVNETIFYEYDTMRIAQLKEGDLHKNDDISSLQICSCDNLPDLFTKSHPKYNFWTTDTKYWSSSSERWLFDWGGDINIFCTLFSFTMVLCHWVFW